MSRLYIVVERPADWGAFFPSDDVITARDYLRLPIVGDDVERTQVINLCRNYKYLGVGYYVSLLAEARGHRVIPSVRTINDLRRRSIYGLDIEDLNAKLTRFLPEEGRDTTEFSLLVYFGTTSYAPLADLARQVFEIFPCPIIKLDFERQKVWQISSIRPGVLHTLTDPQEDAFAQALQTFSTRIWRSRRQRRKYRYDMAMLVDPNEVMPPSNKRALKAFVGAGKELGIEVELITRNDYQRLAEYDSLFIRETTALDNHTYRFAIKAEKEDMVVIDDPTSILRCTNKIYLADLLRSRRLPTPKTEILYRDDPSRLATLPDVLGFPIVLKIPDGSFSRGIVRVEDDEALKREAEALFQHTALVIAQEFLYTEYDWRIGVLDGEALYACQYFMSRGHWQIYNHGSGRGARRSGGFKTLPVRKVPTEIVKLALRATTPIGHGLYGVDIKQLDGRVVIIEVNDNPSIDAGIEDAYLGDDLYRRIMHEFLSRLERRRMGLSSR